MLLTTQCLDEADVLADRIAVDDFAVEPPSLDDVFLAPTGHTADAGALDEEVAVG